MTLGDVAYACRSGICYISYYMPVCTCTSNRFAKGWLMFSKKNILQGQGKSGNFILSRKIDNVNKSRGKLK